MGHPLRSVVMGVPSIPGLTATRRLEASYALDAMWANISVRAIHAAVTEVFVDGDHLHRLPWKASEPAETTRSR